jgi:predicted DNA binding CopG/RHH family protein
MEKSMKGQRLPDTDSIQELARFWDTHDLTDFEPDLEEVGEPVFVRSKGASLSVELPRREIQRVKQMAKSKGVKEATMLREWILERLHESS